MIRNEKGMALMLVLSCVMIMSFIAIELGYNTTVEYAVGQSQIDNLKAYYLAKNGVEISRLRIFVYRTAMQRFGQSLGANKSVLDLIWKFPFSWPLILPDEATSADKDAAKKAQKESLIEGGIAASIDGEGGKIDINDLGSPSKALKEAVYAQLIQIIQNRLDADDDWARDHRDLIRPKEIVDAIADWVDEDNEAMGGGDEKSAYQSPIVPPNRSFKTLDELHYVKGMTDDIFNLIAPRVTVYGVKAINVNLASREVLRSIDRQITEEVADKIIERRSDPKRGQFQNLDDFKNFVSGPEIRLNMETFNKSPEMPLITDAEFNFRIKSTGLFKRAQREIIAIVYDFDKVKEKVASQLATPTATPTAGATTTPTPSQTPGQGATPTPTPTPGADSGPIGPPQIVFWQEF